MFDLVIGQLVRGPLFSSLPRDKQLEASDKIAEGAGDDQGGAGDGGSRDTVGCDGNTAADPARKHGAGRALTTASCEYVCWQ